MVWSCMATSVVDRILKEEVSSEMQSTLANKVDCRYIFQLDNDTKQSVTKMKEYLAEMASRF